MKISRDNISVQYKKQGENFVLGNIILQTEKHSNTTIVCLVEFFLLFQMFYLFFLTFSIYKNSGKMRYFVVIKIYLTNILLL